jgi:TPR repeat protein
MLRTALIALAWALPSCCKHRASPAVAAPHLHDVTQETVSVETSAVMNPVDRSDERPASLRLATFDWPAERAKSLYAAMKKGIAVFRVHERRASLVEDCRIPGRYTTIQIDSQRELARVAGKRAGLRAVESQTWELVTSRVSRAIVPVGSSDYLEGRCDHATHVLWAMASGAAHESSSPRSAASAAPVLIDILLEPLTDFFYRAPAGLPDPILPRRADARDAEVDDGICSPGDEEDCRARCRAGNPRSCYNLTLLLCEPIEWRSSLASHAAQLQSTCNAGVPEACHALSYRYDVGASDPSAMAQLQERACRGGVALACIRRGDLARVRNEPTLRWQAARPWYERACLAGSPGACDDMARWRTTHVEMLYSSGIDDREARKRFERACEAGIARSCEAWAGMLEQGKGGPRDSARAEQVRRCGGKCRR